MQTAMAAGDHEAARQHAKDLKEWLDKGGAAPEYTTRWHANHFADRVLRQTSYLEPEGRVR